MTNRFGIPVQRKRQKDQPATIEQLELRAYLSVSFAPPAFYTGVDSVSGIAAGDLNGDGKPDVVVTGLAPASEIPVVGVYLNNGKGEFGTPTLFPFSGTPAGIALGDFTGSGKLDIAAVDSSTNELDEFLGDGAGNFSPGPGATLGGTSGDSAIAVGDFNGNGKDDVAVVDPSDGEVVVEISNGDGSFASGQNIAVPTPQNVIAGDFNGDGLPDLAILSGNGSIYIALNQGGGVFAAAVPYSLGSNLTSTTGEALADFNRDAINDLVGVGATASGGTAGVLLNQGAGAFGTANSIATANAPVGVVAGDFGADGSSDIALLSATGGLTVLPGNGDGTFGAAVSVFSSQLGSVGTQAVAADFNSDGVPDIAFVSSSGGFGVTLNESAGIASVLSPALLTPLPGGDLIAGQPIKPIHEVVRVTNTGKTAFSGNVAVQLQLSPTQAASSSQVTVGQLTKGLAIPADKSKTVALTIKSLPANFTGSDYLLAQLTDPSGAVGLTASSGTVTIVAPTIDLTGSFTKLPSTARAATGATFTFNVTNDGNIALSGNLLIEVTPSTTPALPAGVVPLQFTKSVKILPRKSTAFKIKGVIATAGTSDYLIVQIDPSNTFNDSNLANNIVVSTTTVAFS